MLRITTNDNLLRFIAVSGLLCMLSACSPTRSLSIHRNSIADLQSTSLPSVVTVGDASLNLAEPESRASISHVPNAHEVQPIQHVQHLQQAPVPMPATALQNPPGIPPQAYTGPPQTTPWTPTGISAPFPEDEYVFQGGDGYQLTNVAQDFSIDNLDEEDTIAHFHTLDGDIQIERTNRIPIYAPRFASVRRVDGLNQYRHQDHVYAVDSPLAIDGATQSQGQEQVKQQVSSQRNIGTKASALYRENQKLRDMAHQVASLEGSQLVKPQVGDLLNTKVNIQNSQEARLSIQQQTAIAQTDEETAKEYAYDLLPYKILSNNKIQTNYHYEIAEGNSRLDIKKVASKQDALPGELLEFTITFRNTGDKAIGNVTIVDHLSRRLAYVEGSQNSTLESEFFVNPTGKDSAILRWEIAEPMEVGQSAQVTFKCRVR